jgi:hypothetical protein
MPVSSGAGTAMSCSSLPSGEMTEMHPCFATLAKSYRVTYRLPCGSRAIPLGPMPPLNW